MSFLFDDASSQSVVLSSFDVGAAYPLTMGGWFYMDADITGPTIASVWNSGSTNYHRLQFRLASAGLQGRTRVASSDAVFTTTQPAINTWNHGCYVCTNSTSRTVYLNGGNSATATVDLTPAPNRTSFGEWEGVNFMTGRLAHCFIYSAALTAAEVAALATGVPPSRIRPDSLVHYLFWGNDSSPGIDIGSNHTPFTVNGTPTVADGAPVAPAFGYDVGFPPVAAAPAGGHANRLVGATRLTTKVGGVLVA